MRSLLILAGIFSITACTSQAPPTKPAPQPIVTLCVPTCAFYPVQTWEDLNQDGIYSKNEPPLPGVKVRLKVAPSGDYYTSSEKTDATGSVLLCFGDPACSNELPKDLLIEVIAIGPDGCTNTTPTNLPEKPEQKENHWNQPDEPYEFGFWCSEEQTPTNSAPAIPP